MAITPSLANGWSGWSGAELPGGGGWGRVGGGQAQVQRQRLVARSVNLRDSSIDLLHCGIS